MLMDILIRVYNSKLATFVSVKRFVDDNVPVLNTSWQYTKVDRRKSA